MNATPLGLVARVATLVCFLLIALCSCNRRDSSSMREPVKVAAAQATPPKNRALETSLHQAAERLFSTLKEGKVDDLLPFFSSSGVSFEVDGPTVPLTAIERSFKRRNSYYCLFFDTSCLLRQDSGHRAKAGASPRTDGLYSIRDTINRNREQEFKVLLNTRDKQPFGQLSIGSLEFILDSENGNWKIVSLEYD